MMPHVNEFLVNDHIAELLHAAEQERLAQLAHAPTSDEPGDTVAAPAVVGRGLADRLAGLVRSVTRAVGTHGRPTAAGTID